jgi:hypothetical protein
MPGSNAWPKCAAPQNPREQGNRSGEVIAQT